MDDSKYPLFNITYIYIYIVCLYIYIRIPNMRWMTG